MRRDAAGLPMSRDDGFAVADLSVNLYDDDKVKRLYRELDGDLGRMGHAMMLCEATLLASWRDGHRVTVYDAAPIWMTVDDELVAVLVRVGLLDKTHRRPIRSWNAWFGPANERREARRESGRLGGLRARGKRTLADALSTLNSSADSSATASPHLTVRPSDRPSSSRARAKEATVQGTNGRTSGPQSLAAIIPDAFAASRKS